MHSLVTQITQLLWMSTSVHHGNTRPLADT